jgi:type IV secretory pathway VirJ component
MRRVSFCAPYGDFWLSVYEGKLREATRWEDIAGKRSAVVFLDDLCADNHTVNEVAECIQIWAAEEGNHHPDTNYRKLAEQLLKDAEDEAAELAEGDA